MKKLTSQIIKNFISQPLFDDIVLLKKDTSWPRISVVTPSYNQKQFLERTILSVLNQNYPNLEYVIMDGGSKDGSVDIIKKYERYLTYWVSKPDKGQSDAIRQGFEKCSGNILAYLNSDDIYLPGTFTTIIRAFQQYPAASLIFGNSCFIDARDQLRQEHKLTKIDMSHFVYENLSISQQSTFWTKEIYDKVGGINARYKFCMDFDLFIRIADVGKLVHIPERIAGFRIHSDSKTSTILNIRDFEHNEIVERYRPRNVNELYLFYRKNLCRIKRIFYYIKQGDTIYILQKCFNRLRGISFMDELKA